MTTPVNCVKVITCICHRLSVHGIKQTIQLQGVLNWIVNPGVADFTGKGTHKVGNVITEENAFVSS